MILTILFLKSSFGNSIDWTRVCDEGCRATGHSNSYLYASMAPIYSAAIDMVTLFQKCYTVSTQYVPIQQNVSRAAMPPPDQTAWRAVCLSKIPSGWKPSSTYALPTKGKNPIPLWSICTLSPLSILFHSNIKQLKRLLLTRCPTHIEPSKPDQCAKTMKAPPAAAK